MGPLKAPTHPTGLVTPPPFRSVFGWVAATSFLTRTPVSFISGLRPFQVLPVQSDYIQVDDITSY